MTLSRIGRALGMSPDGKSVTPELFTGSKAGELEFFSKLSPVQKEIYRQAQRDRGASVRFFRQYADQLLASDPEARHMVGVNASRSARARQQPANT